MKGFVKEKNFFFKVKFEYEKKLNQRVRCWKVLGVLGLS